MSLDFKTAFGRPDFPLDGVHLVAASAGTGKTWNIGNIFARLLMANGWRVPQILVVTFTEAATRELRERLRGLLEKLQAEFQAPGSTRDVQAQSLVALLPPGEAARRRARRAVDEALLEFDQAAISTIHAFCGRALRRYAFESGLSFDAEPPSEVRAAQLESAARDWWRRKVALVPAGEAPAPGFSLADLLATLNQLDRPGIRSAGDAASDPAKARLLEVAQGLVDRWYAERPERKAPDFDDILLGMRAALCGGPGREAFAEALRREYAAVLVDEFQDTDPVQYDIFREAFLADGRERPVYFIGDPKQAIYAFRGGDIYTYREAAAAVPADRRYSLRENFRSAPGVVRAVNALFGDGGDGKSVFGESIPHPGDIVAAGGKLDLDGGEARAVQFVEVPDGTPEPQACADEIAALLRHPPLLREEKDGHVTERRLEAGDIAVLVRNGVAWKGRAIAERLAGMGIRAAVLDSRRSVFGEPEADAFRVLLAAFADPARAAVVRAALLTPFFGLSAGAVSVLARPDGALAREDVPDYPFLARREDPGAAVGMTDFLRAFQEWTECWRASGFLSAFARMEDALALRKRLAGGPRGERALVNILHLAELVHVRASAGTASPAALLDWFSLKAADESGDEACLRLESDENAVHIQSLHSSKGLEFPVVFMPDAHTRGGVRRKALWQVWHRPSPDGGAGRSELVIGLDGGEAEERERQEEETRLFYVGITRAAWRCIAFVPEKAGNIQSPPFLALLERAREAARAGAGVECRPFEPGEAAAASGEAGRTVEWLPAPVPPSLPQGFGRGSFSSLSPAGGDASARHRPAAETVFDARDLDAGSEAADVPGVSGGVEEPSGHPIFAFPGGTGPGTCWHAIFEEADFRATDAELRPLVEKKLLAAGLLRGTAGVRTARTAAVLDMVRRTLELPLDEPGGGTFRLCDIPPEDRVSEWEFDFSSRGAASSTARLRDVLEKHWGGEPAGSDHRVFLRTLDSWDRPIPKGFLMGFIDLAFRRGGRYYIVDWKSNSLRRRESAFSPAGLRDEMAAHAYFLQYLVYSAVLHRHLRDSLPGYDWSRHFGGVRYLFLRGAAIGHTAVYADRPSESLLDDFATALGL